MEWTRAVDDEVLKNLGLQFADLEAVPPFERANHMLIDPDLSEEHRAKLIPLLADLLFSLTLDSYTFLSHRSSLPFYRFFKVTRVHPHSNSAKERGTSDGQSYDSSDEHTPVVGRVYTEVGIQTHIIQKADHSIGTEWHSDDVGNEEMSEISAPSFSSSDADGSDVSSDMIINYDDDVAYGISTSF